jgi:outer membrane protein assembly factor BamB
VVGPGDARAYRSADGGLVWQAATPGCAGRSFTGAGGLLGLACGADTRLLDTADGERLATLQGAGAEPLGCGAAYSGCGAVRINDKAWLLGARTPVESPTLAAVGARLAGTTAVDTDGATIVGRDPRTGARRWAFPIAASVLATQPDRVHLLAADHMLVTLDAATGRELSRFRYVAEDGAVDWDPGRTYAAGGYLATERRHEPEYPYPVILAAT